MDEATSLSMATAAKERRDVVEPELPGRQGKELPALGRFACVDHVPMPQGPWL